MISNLLFLARPKKTKATNVDPKVVSAGGPAGKAINSP
jgi:hypothetical protein